MKIIFNDIVKLKADQPHPRDYLHTPPDYKHTDKTLGPVMTPLYSKFEHNCLLLHSACWAPNIDCLTLTFDLDLKAR